MLSPLEKIVSLNDDLKQSLRDPAKAFVGAVMDLSSPDGAGHTALIVGINYGQTDTSKPEVFAETVRYARHAQTIGGKPFQTVLWNFFPHLTDSEWLEDNANAADEADCLFNRGYQDPLTAFAQVAEALNPAIVIFHGFNSAVPLLAHLALKHTQAESVFLVPNLSRGLNPNKILRLR